MTQDQVAQRRGLRVPGFVVLLMTLVLLTKLVELVVAVVCAAAVQGVVIFAR